MVDPKLILLCCVLGNWLYWNMRAYKGYLSFIFLNLYYQKFDWSLRRYVPCHQKYYLWFCLSNNSLLFVLSTLVSCFVLIFSILSSLISILAFFNHFCLLFLCSSLISLFFYNSIDLLSFSTISFLCILFVMSLSCLILSVFMFNKPKGSLD